MTDLIQQQLDEGLLTVRLNRADKLNALTNAMYTRLAELFEAANSDPQVEVILITGSTECFTAGNDLADFLDQPPTDLQSPVFRMMWAVLALDKPLIAAVAGPAIGIGTTLLLHCDQVLVSRDAKLRTPFVALGVCPEFGASLLLPQVLGHVRAAQLLLCNQALNGEQAVQWGLASELFDDGAQCLAAAVKLARRLQQLPADALRISRRLLKDGQREALAATVAKEGLLFIERLNSDAARAALTAMVSRKGA
ncbi:enoyl-CoA hydratase-related protein [Pseudomonas vlassakiae]|uniref:enoyl-CoA hydratase-related protein n=1 Tax=Pseudomonas vlassakiae TaxID=485888 RepID=UPI0021CA4AD3|nr:enoyl-CoA hydratase-related protein [Pseudomonas vlassakiae]MCU0122949.1 enoyl-CoA hydratase-related protein [Pseudomonas vlassakiae]